MKNVVAKPFSTHVVSGPEHDSVASSFVPHLDGEPVEIVSMDATSATVRYLDGVNNGLTVSVSLSRLHIDDERAGEFASVFEPKVSTTAGDNNIAETVQRTSLSKLWREGLSYVGVRPGQLNNAGIVVGFMGLVLMAGSMSVLIPVFRTALGLGGRLLGWLSKGRIFSKPDQSEARELVAHFEKILAQRWSRPKIEAVRKKVSQRQWASFAKDTAHGLHMYLDAITSSTGDNALKDKLIELGCDEKNAARIIQDLNVHIDSIIDAVEKTVEEINNEFVDGLINTAIGVVPALGLFLTATASSVPLALLGATSAVLAGMAYFIRFIQGKVPPLDKLFEFSGVKPLQIEADVSPNF